MSFVLITGGLDLSVSSVLALGGVVAGIPPCRDAGYFFYDQGVNF